MQRLSTRLKLSNARTHDLRRTLATGLGDLGVAEEVIERILNHAPRSVAGRHYNHAKYQEPMRRALERWEQRLLMILENSHEPSNVVALATGERLQ